MAWKKVHVKGKGDRWTDGKGNYRYSHPNVDKPGQALSSAKSGVGSLLKKFQSDFEKLNSKLNEMAQSEANKIGQGYSRAATKTQERLANEQQATVQRGFGSNQRFARTAAENKPAPKAAQPTINPGEKAGPPAPEMYGPPNPKPRSPAAAAPIHASPQAFGSGPRLQAAPSVYAPQAGAAPKPNTPQPSSYGADGKSLYNAGKGDNPLMQRTFGYQTGQAPDQQAAAPKAPEPQMSQQYQGNDQPGALGQAENPMAALGELLNRKKISISLSN
jgi:ElaB/YqjD/DUF883 family membrane-anchored ribosome-binding protein